MAVQSVLKCAAFAVVALAFAAPALADGRDQALAAGPSPLQPVSCEQGHVVDGKCYVSRQTTTHVIRRPVETHPDSTVRRVVRAQPVTQGFDFSGFTGGVGAGVTGGFVGGGSRIIVVSEGQRFSGVRSRPLGQAVLSGRFGGTGFAAGG